MAVGDNNFKLDKEIYEIMYQSVLIGIEKGHESERAIEAALDLGEMFDSEIHVVYILNSRLGRSSRWMEQYEKQGDEILQEVEEKAAKRSISITTTMSTGDPVSIILGQAESDDYDLIIINSRYRPRLERVILKDTPEKLIRRTQIPVLVV